MKTPKKRYLTLFAALAFSTVHADFLDATEAYDKKQYDVAFKEYSELARLGNKRAQFNLGVMYLNGEGVEKNLALAYAWGKLSEHDARPEFAQISKSVLATVSPKDHSQLESKAAEFKSTFGETAIHTKLSPIEYSNSENSDIHSPNIQPIERPAPRYPKEALNQKKQGWTTAMMDIHPDGSVRDIEIIESFPDDSFDRTTADTLLKFKFDVKFPEGTEPYVVQAKQTLEYQLKLKGNATKIKDIYKERLDTLKGFAIQGHPDAQYTYAVAARSNLLAKDEAIEQKEANEWLLKAAQNGQVEAQYLLGKNILRGNGCEIEKQKAVDWIVYAAEKGHDKSAREVYHLLSEDRNLNNTNKSPETWLKLSAEAGNPESQLEYVQFLAEENKPTPESIKVAEQYLQAFTKSRKKNVNWYQAAASIESIKGNEKLAKKYSNKAEKMAKKLGWDLSTATL